MKDELFEWMIEESQYRRKRMSRDRHHSGPRMDTESFRCKCCDALVLRATYISGVLNRNHCPYCLSSRHVDWQRAGDRMSACKGKMHPVGLALKRDNNKYASHSGELMVIHLCEDCGQVSANRIAADDCAETLLAVFEDTALLTADVRASLRDAGIEWLTEDKIHLVYRRLYGTEEVGRAAPAGAAP